jgi:hypothetical protein
VAVRYQLDKKIKPKKNNTGYQNLLRVGLNLISLRKTAQQTAVIIPATPNRKNLKLSLIKYKIFVSITNPGS